ncbi:MAG: class I SAM-dependent methyltransferase [Candidatus Neomarinimicrobiota bacterium]
MKLTEFIAEKMNIKRDRILLDVGANRGYQTCFLAKEYGIFAVAIDPTDDRVDNKPVVEHIRENATKWGVSNKIIAIKLGVPNTFFSSDTFDYVYSSTTFEMIRCQYGEKGYLDALQEIYRILKSGGIFGLGEPMHLEKELPKDLIPYVSQREDPWKDCFSSISKTKEFVIKAGFEVVEADYAPDAKLWWAEYAKFDPFCIKDPKGDPMTLKVDNGRWVSFGYVIAKKRNNKARTAHKRYA